MKQIPYIIGCLLLLSDLSAQQSTIQFSNATYNWNHLFIDSTKIDEDGLDGKNHLFYFSDDHSFIQDNYLYNVLINAEGGSSGALIEKIGLQAGESEWKTFFDKTTSGEHEYPSTFRLDENGDLEIVGYRNSLEQFPVFWYEGMPFTRYYSPESGNLLSHDTIPTNDTLAKPLRFFFENLKLDRVDSGYRQTFNQVVGAGVKASHVLRNQYSDAGHFVASDSSETFYYYDNVRTSNKLLSDGGQGILFRRLDADENTTESFLYITNESLETISFRDVTEYIGSPDDAYIGKVTNDIIEVVCEYHYFGTNDMEVYYHHFDMEGNHLTEHKIERTINYSITSITLKNGVFIVAVSRPRLDDQSEGEVVFFGMNSADEFVELKKVHVSSNSALVLYKMLEDGNDNLILLGRYSPIISSNGSLANEIFESVAISIPQSEIGLTTSTFELYKDILLSIYPNPSSDVLSITLDERIVRSQELRYMITSVDGSLVKSGIFTPTIDVKTLPCGTYLLTLLDGKQKIETQRWIKGN
jgi:hypothetical protein